jgi:hypothetical protein
LAYLLRRNSHPKQREGIMKNLVIMVSSLTAMMLMLGLVPPSAEADTIYVGDTIKLNWASSAHNPTGGGPFLLADLTTSTSFLS